MEISDKEISDLVLRHVSGSDGFDAQSIRVYRYPRSANSKGARIEVVFNITRAQEQDDGSTRAITGYRTEKNSRLAHLARELGVFGQVFIKGSRTPSSTRFTFETYPPQDRPRWDTATESTDSFVTRNESTTISAGQFEPFVVRARSADGTYVDYHFNLQKLTLTLKR
jgi:hypothetical protein